MFECACTRTRVNSCTRFAVLSITSVRPCCRAFHHIRPAAHSECLFKCHNEWGREAVRGLFIDTTFPLKFGPYITALSSSGPHHSCCTLFPRFHSVTKHPGPRYSDVVALELFSSPLSDFLHRLAFHCLNQGCLHASHRITDFFVSFFVFCVSAFVLANICPRRLIG